MRLKQIDIEGFKSFADTVSLQLAPGVTAIVGPNGSGKSNISDAVRWVLGEQNARALRGTKMEDVIFNGAENRRPLSYCEVTLTFENEDGFLHIPTTEVSVSRRVFRNGDSEYLINQSTCRMRDIQALFYDTGVGKEGYSIIGQGRIEEILSSKGDERRAALEEAAGVMKYKVRREEAQRKLKNVDADMLRVTDIISEIESSLEPLQHKSEEARRYLSLRDTLKDLEINLFLEQYDRNRQRVEGVRQSMAEREAFETQQKQRQADLQIELSLENEKIELTEKLLSLAKDKAVELASNLQRHIGDAQLHAQRAGFLHEQVEELTRQQRSDDVRIQELRDLLSQQADAVSVDFAQLEARAQELMDSAKAASDEVSAREEALDVLKEQLMDVVNSAGESKARLARMETLRAQALERKTDLDARAQTAKAEVEGLQAELVQAQQAYEQAAQAQKNASDAYTQLQAEVQALQQQLTQAQAQAQDAIAQAKQSEHAHAMQKQLARDYEGYTNSVRSLMRDVQNGRVDHHGVLGTVGVMVQVPQELEKAIEQALGGSLQNVIVDDSGVAKRLIEYLRVQHYGRVTFLPQQSLRVRTFTQHERAQMQRPGVLGCASELISFSESVRPAITFLLGRTLVVRDLDAGIAVTKSCPFSFRCVTLLGDILQSGGAMTGGSVRERGLVSRERLIAQAAQKAQQDAQHAQALLGNYSALQQTYQERRAELETRQQALYAHKAEISVLHERLDGTQFALEKAQHQHAQLLTECARIEQMLTSTQAELSHSAQIGQQDEAVLRQRIEQQTQSLLSVRERYEALSEQAHEARQTLAVQRSEQAAQAGEQARRERELERLEQRKQTRSEQLCQAQQKREQAQMQNEETQSHIGQMQQEVADNQSALQTLQAQLKKLQSQSQVIVQEDKKIAEVIAQSVEARYRAQAQLERLDVEFETMQQKLWDDYELSYAQVKPMQKPIAYQETARQVRQIQAEIREMDAVHPGAIEEYQRVRERYEFLTTQRDDLQKAKGDLEALIEELTQQMQKQFLAQFDVINEHFSRIFVALFGGGKASMRLQDPENAMECGIDIIAQPPGKNLQLITLLSGGERALTAIALLFALLEVRATPFCILDEIEAALDEENLRLFADFLKVYAKHTQFIVITHRRPTMEAAETMYGIAMEQKGVSKLVSVRFA